MAYPWTAGEVVTATDLNAAIAAASTGGSPGGSDGQIQYNDGGAFGGASSLVYDDVNGRVGIGTTSPNRNLHVQQASSGATAYNLTGGIDIETDNISGLNILSPNNGYGRIYFGSPVSNTAGAVEYIHNATLASGYMKIRAGGADRIYIHGNGNIGINQFTPSYTLDVNGTGRFTGDLIAGSGFITVNPSSGTEGGEIRLDGGTSYGTSYARIDRYGSNLLRFMDSSAVRMQLDITNGNLTVNGSLTTSSGITAGGEIRANGNISLRSGNNVRDSIYRVGGIFFTWDSDSYGTNTNHCIRSTYGDTWGDHITINSYGSIRMNIDTNGNGSNTFQIGRHTTGSGNILLNFDESANLHLYGGQLGTTKNSTGNVGNASLNLGLGQGSGAILAMNVYNYAPLITIGSGEIFYVRNYLNSTYAWLYGYINNVSSKHHKTNIRTLGEPTASVGSAGTTFNAMEKVRQLRPVTYHLYERDALPRMPKNEDGTKNQRRIDAINRLDKIRKKNGLGHFERDDLKHICGRDCEGDIQNPCFHYKNWSKGKIGFIAQEVGEVLNEVADFSEERPDEHESIDSLGLIAICVKALQEIDTRLAQLEAS